MSRKLYSLCGSDRTRPFSPHVWKTKMSLAHKGLDFDVVPIGFTETQASRMGPRRWCRCCVTGNGW